MRQESQWRVEQRPTNVTQISLQRHDVDRRAPLGRAGAFIRNALVRERVCLLFAAPSAPITGEVSRWGGVEPASAPPERRDDGAVTAEAEPAPSSMIFPPESSVSVTRSRRSRAAQSIRVTGLTRRRRPMRPHLVPRAAAETSRALRRRCHSRRIARECPLHAAKFAYPFSSGQFLILMKLGWSILLAGRGLRSGKPICFRDFTVRIGPSNTSS
jgi:hypothetical protein